MWLHQVPDRSPCLLCRAVKGPQHAGKVLGRLWDLLDQNGLFMPLVCSMGQGCPYSHSSPGKCHQPLQGEGEKPRPPHFSPVSLLCKMLLHVSTLSSLLRSAIKYSRLPRLPASQMCWEAIKHLTGMGFKVHLAAD